MSGKQLRMVYALARNAGIDNDTLHDIVRGLTGCESLTELSPAEGARVIDRMKGKSVGGDIPNRATQKQQWLIRTLEREMGWDKDPRRLRGLTEKLCGVSDLKFLSIENARVIIEALKGMQRGGRSERKRIQ